ncbi:MAG TPA: dihydrodipicolinate reductase C-terminal domain-containing protein [Thermoanaerobaculia bacterium]|jgi:4-hydroxy-tetrahydrodipicolinate reductase|nr:dihydrodipicolinate reductase C-terminal domain-containing protein [Thermoanaerobaculia bacterium]
MNRLALLGYGRMGRLVEQFAPAHGFEVALRLDGRSNAGGEGISPESLQGIDAAVDFSTAAAVAANAERIAALGVPLVVGTTGWASDLQRVREAVERQGGGLLYGANFSVGVQVFYRLAEAAARLLAEESAYDAWAYEIHHRMKKDAPSGTLLQLRKVMEAAGYGRPIDVASNRAGAIPGTHQIGFDSDADTILLEHRARSRAGFAHGALRAARWMVGRRGIYEFSEVWEEIVQERNERAKDLQ